MSSQLRNRLTRMERRAERPPMTRTILAARADYDEPLETHDDIRAQLHIRPEVGVHDLVCYNLKKGEPPRLKFPHGWRHTIYQSAETVVETTEAAEALVAESVGGGDTVAPNTA
jgi:hypothetical protein